MHVVHRLSHISEEAPRLYLFESKLHTLLCDFNELFLLRLTFPIQYILDESEKYPFKIVEQSTFMMSPSFKMTSFEGNP